MEQAMPQPDSAEHEVGYEIDRTFDTLPAGWGFIEPEGSDELKRDAIEGILVKDFAPAIAYRLAAEQNLDHLRGVEQQRAEIGMLATIATLYRDAGLIEEYLDGLHDAWLCACRGKAEMHADIIAAIETEAAQYLNDNL